MPSRATVVVALLLAVAGCGRDVPQGGESAATTSTTGPAQPAVGCDGEMIVGGAAVTCEVPGWPDRAADVHLPAGYDENQVWPVVVALHGGGGNRNAAARTACPGGNVGDPGCLHALGDREGFLTVYPDGFPRRPRGQLRTWNAGGSGDLDCVSAAACEAMSDDVAYVTALLDLLAAHYSIEPRVTVTGLSNGGAMSHRLGCELADRVRVVAAVGGANQQPGCAPSMPVSVIQIHGTDDPCWPYAGGTLGTCGSRDVRVAGAEDTAEGWAVVLGCDEPTETAMPNSASDGTEASRRDWRCPEGVEVALVTIVGGGHTWPQGFQFAPSGLVGLIAQDFSANELIWEFAASG